MNQRVALLAVMTVALGLAGCRSGSTGPGGSEPTSSGPPPGDRISLAALATESALRNGQPVTGCDLLTPAEVAAVIGAADRAPDDFTNRGTAGAVECEY